MQCLLGSISSGKARYKNVKKTLLFFIESLIVIAECLPLQRRLGFDSQQLDKPKNLNMVITVFY